MTRYQQFNAPLRYTLLSIISGLLIICSLSGCFKKGTEPQDPYESYNRKIFAVNEKLDKTIFKPLAKTYVALVPALIRTGVNNFFSNLLEITVAANSFLQHDTEHLVSASRRFIINSSIGVLGFVDVASELEIEKHYTDMGITFAKWGDKKSPYLVLLFFGPSTVRDSYGATYDYVLFNPYLYFIPNRYVYIGTAYYYLTLRANLLDSEKILQEAALDPYVFQRDAYLQRRNFLINGKENDEDPLIEDEDEDDLLVDEENKSETKETKDTKESKNKETKAVK